MECKITERKTVVWDGDNTLWDWMGYAVPAYIAMRNAIAILAIKTDDGTAQAMRDYYAEKGTVEDEGLVQGLHAKGFFSSNSNFDLRTAARDVQRVFSTVRREKLKLYEHIEDTVKQIHALGWRQVLLTDAPGNQAAARLKHFNLTPYFEEVFAMRSAALPPHAPTNGFVHTSYVVDKEKPHTDLEVVLAMTHEQIVKLVTIIGDNNAKDMELARRYGAVGIHTVFGIPAPDFASQFAQFATPHVANRNLSATATVTAHTAPGRIVVAQHPEDIRGILLLS